ncbi:MAG: hypothetical protein ACRC36_26690 [Lacrimispora sphenoides]
MMEKILSWIKENKVKSVLIMILIVLIPMIVIHILYKIKLNNFYIASVWDAGDMLGYFGNTLSFVGTLLLGLIAVSQTEKANAINNRLFEMEKKRVKPCFDFINGQRYKIYLGPDLETLDMVREEMTIEVLYCSEPRSGITMDTGLIELEVINSGHSDIRNIFVKNILFYFNVTDPHNEYERMAFVSGNTNIKVGEKKRLFISVKKEILRETELNEDWYLEHSKDILPHLDLELHLITTDGSDYWEKISCGSSWNSSMVREGSTIERGFGVLDIHVSEAE